MTCQYCEIIDGKRKAAKVFEDHLVVAFLSEAPATIGHLIVIPKKHHVILEEMEAVDAAHMFEAANRLSIAMFETLKIEGTNLLLNNGVAAGQEQPHISVHIIARKAGDGLSFEWAPKQMDEQQMATVEMKLKEEMDRHIVPTTPARHESTPIVKQRDKGEPIPGKEAPVQVDKESYLIKQLRRVP